MPLRVRCGFVFSFVSVLGFFSASCCCLPLFYKQRGEHGCLFEDGGGWFLENVIRYFFVAGICKSVFSHVSTTFFFSFPRGASSTQSYVLTLFYGCLSSGVMLYVLWRQSGGTLEASSGWKCLIELVGIIVDG